MKLLRNANLQLLNTLASPSVAEFFARAATLDDIREALRWARQKQLPVRILGGGSNCLLAEKISGLVLQPLLRGVECIESDNTFHLVKAASGENWNRLVHHCLAKKYYGLENLALIPGLVGAAPIQNIGAYGVELGDFLHSLEAVDIASGKLHTFTKEACAFTYRNSVFKGTLANRYIITSITMRLFREPHPNLSYPALNDALEGIRRSAITPEIIAHTVSEIRRAKLPSPEDIPNVGSFFKNPIVDLAVIENLKQLYPDLVTYDVDADHKKVPAAWLIEKGGWKGREVFGVKVHDQQALVLTNPNKLPASKVLKLAKAIQSNIKARFDIELEQEPQVLG